MFKTKSKFLTRPADRLSEILSSKGISLPKTFNFKDATARTFGYENRSAVPDELKDESPRDEELHTNSALNKRRTQQAEYLSNYALEIGVPLLDARILMDEWQPSAKHPKRSVVTKEEAEKRIRKGIINTGFNLVADLLHKAKNTSLRIEKFDVDFLMTTMDCMQINDKYNGKGKDKGKQYQMICCDVGMLAAAMINQDALNTVIGSHNAVQGVVLLDRLCEENVYPFARVSLFQACQQGWGCTQDYKRARELITLIDKMCKRPEILYKDTVDGVFMHWESRFDYLTRKVDVLYACNEDETVISTLKEVFSHRYQDSDKGRGVWAARHLLRFAKEETYPHLFTEEEVAAYQKATANLMLDMDIKGTYYTVA